MANIPMQFFGCSDAVALPVHDDLHVDGEPHKIPAGAVAAHEKLMKVLIHQKSPRG